jgi:sugar-specific transcriptional regulator TrmB
MIEEYLEKIGLTETEATLYLLIFKRQRITPAQLSKETNIKRPTVYAAVSELIRMGLVEEDNTSKIKYYIALSPEQIHYLIKNKERELERKKEYALKVVSELEEIPRVKNFSVPETKVVEGIDLIEKFLYKRFDVWANSMVEIKETTWWGFQDKNILKHKVLGKWIDWANGRNEKIDIKLLTNESEVELEANRSRKYKNRNLQFFDNVQFTATQWIAGDYVINLTVKNGRDYLVEIKDKVLAENLRNIYRYLYKN